MRPCLRRQWSLPDSGHLNIRKQISLLSNQQGVSEELRPGQVVEYLHNNQPVPAWVQEVQSSRVRILNINQRELKLPGSRVLPWKGPIYSPELSRQEVLELLKQHQQKRVHLQEDLDVHEVWSMTQGEIQQVSVYWLAGLVWEQPDHDRIAALGRALLQAKAYFRFNPPDFEIYPEEIVEKKLEEQHKAREKERLISRGKEFLMSLYSHAFRAGPAPEPPDPDIAQKLKEVLVRRVKYPDDPHTQDLWAKLTAGLPQEVHLPFLLARAWGIYPDHYNYLLDQAEYMWGDEWAEEYLPDIESIKDELSKSAGDPGLEDLISIDSTSTRDIDDAFLVREHGQGFSVSIALAGPGLFWQFGSELDRAVANRATSLYLPEGNSDMLPREFAEDLFSLKQNQVRPALVLHLELDALGEIKKFEPRLDRVLVRANRTYSDVEEELAANSESSLKCAYTLASILRRKRVEQGAVIIDQSDPMIMLTNTQEGIQVHLEEDESCPGAQLIVSELMLLCNTAFAGWAKDRKLPLLYRTQDIALPRDFCGVWSSPEDIYRVIRSLGATLTETAPRPHRSIGVSAYASVTSPLRRYVDLVNQAQIAAVLREKKPPFDREGLEAMLPVLNARTGVVGRVQKFRPRYWKLLHFKQRGKNATWRGVVVDNSGPVVLCLPREQILVRAGHETFGGKTRIGQVFQLRLGKIDPLSNEIHVLEAWED